LAKVIEQVEACYEVEEMEFGTLYKWCPESLVIECDCSRLPSRVLRMLRARDVVPTIVEEWVGGWPASH
jgi:hypothetical protein